MTLNHLLGWATLFASFCLFLYLAGPCSRKPLCERLLMWSVFASMMCLGVFRLIPNDNLPAMNIIYTIAAGSRIMIALTALFSVAVYEKRLHQLPPSRRTRMCPH